METPALTPEETEEILNTARSIMTSDDAEEVKAVVCKFYRDGGCEGCDDLDGCAGCVDDTKIFECRDEYVRKIFHRPMKAWSPDFDKLKVREKVKLSVIQDTGLNCDSCYMSDKCPHFEKYATCAIDWNDEEVDPTKPKDVLTFLINTQQRRVARAVKFEEIDGGVPDTNASSEMDRLAGFVQQKANMDQDRMTFNVSASATSGEGTKAAGGLLAKLFGGMSSGNADEPKALGEKTTIEIPFEDISMESVKERKRRDAEK